MAPSSSASIRQQPYGQPQYGQPQYGQPYGQPAGAPPQNYLVWAILSTLFCCLPLGIASIVFAAQVNGKYQAGDHAGAQESSEKAKKFAIWSADRRRRRDRPLHPADRRRRCGLGQLSRTWR